MRVLIIGSGAREHALAWKLSQSPILTRLYCAPGNPGISAVADLVPIRTTDIHQLLAFALAEQIDLAVVGPEQPLAEGIVDEFETRGLRIFGPSRRAAKLEWSKVFAKAFMQRRGIPTAAHASFSLGQRDAAERYIRTSHHPLVLKADGLAAGKGVVICSSVDASLDTLHSMMEDHVFGRAGESVVIEEFLVGEEASVFAVSDGKDYVVLAPAQDHKRACDGDTGKNTGGMGAYAPTPLMNQRMLTLVETKIIRPTLDGMREDGSPFIGCLYVGLMITDIGPTVVEYNCRFGDPETQVVLPLYGGDLLELLNAAAGGSIARLKITGTTGVTGDRSAVCVVLASGGYPDGYTTGFEISGTEAFAHERDLLLFHAGTKQEGDRIVTAGGRVLSVTAVSDAGLEHAIARAYEGVSRISFTGMHFRRDIGKKAFVH